ncbi:MAG: adenylate/guanylate cyclase domain-containing protein, partial [Rhizobacter sp.]|nr:adenylate/guanylate cyclase domain-containing protein [Chlorobiales bacterium]
LILTLLCYVSSLLYRYFTEGREKLILKRAFETYVPPDVVQQVLDNSDALSLGGDKRFLTVLFSDIRGFTTYSEVLDPQELVRLLNFYLSAMSDVIFNNRGTIDKFIGDAIMAIFGAPVPQPDSAAQACRTALDMLRELEKVNERQRTEGHPPLSIGIGINSGEMTVGNIGSNRRFDYTVIGDAVNLGSRLEGLNKYFKTTILVSESTKDKCSDAEFLFREIAPVQVKGKDRPVMVYELLTEQKAAASMTAWLEPYSAGLSLYKEKRFAEAAACFQQSLAANPNDGPSAYYLALCHDLKERPEQFNAVVVMDAK